MTLKTNQIIKLWVQAGLSFDFINNASDWHMVKNGIISSQCPDGFITDLKVGDFVEWKNDYNITFKSKVIGFAINELCEYLSDKFVYLDSDCFWCPVSLSVIKKL